MVMSDDRLAAMQAKLAEPFFRHWRLMLVAAWLLYVLFIAINRWNFG